MLSQEELFGAKPRPSVLILGFDDEVVRSLTPLFPASIAINDVSTVRMEEWDLLITAVGAAHHWQDSTSGPLIPVSSIFVLGFGPGYFGIPAEATFNDSRAEIGTTAEAVASQFRIPPELPSPIQRLVKQDLIPKASEHNKHRVLAETLGPNPTRLIRQNEIRPFLVTSQGEIMAGSFVRRGSSAECWVLPSYASPDLWAKLAISEWEAVAPDRFPPQPDWTTSTEWQTRAELKALADKQSLEEERNRLLADLDSKENEVALRIESKRLEANTKERSLLTARGAELVVIVKTALEEFGFTVRSMDSEFPKGDLREDFRVTRPDSSEWEAIVEVRGYNGGAAVTDLMRLQRFAQRYETDEGHPPSACWYIVNQFASQHPAERPSVLASQPNEVTFFVDTYQGLLIDTTKIFRLWLQLQNGEEVPEDIGAKLVAARGVFS